MSLALPEQVIQMAKLRRRLEIAHDHAESESLLYDAGYIIEALMLQPQGSLTIFHDPTDEQVRRLTELFDIWRIHYNLAWGLQP